jgi:hypothetical protein
VAASVFFQVFNFAAVTGLGFFLLHSIGYTFGQLKKGISVVNREQALPHVLAVILIALAGLCACLFVWQDSLGGFADDGVSYMIMAKAMSPYSTASEVISQASHYEKYPPLFPLVLALSGAAYSFVYAHLLVALFFVASLASLYLYAGGLFRSPWPALVTVALFAVSPAVWLNMLGILSESLYIFLGMLALLWHDRMRQRTPENGDVKDVLILTTLLSACILSRSVGVALVMAVAISGFMGRRRLTTFTDWRWYVPLIVPLVCALLWAYGRPTAGHDLYAQDVGGIAGNVLDKGLSGFILPQLDSLYRSLFTSYILFWKTEWQPSFLIIVVFNLCGLSFLVQRLRRHQADAWYLLIYLGILLVWPYPGQFNRFIYAIAPLLILYGVGGFLYWIYKLPQSPLSKPAPLIGMLVMATAMLPPAVFMADRAGYQTPYANMHYDNVSLFYNVPRLDIAAYRAHLQEQLRLDMQAIKESTAQNAKILWYTPNYIELLAQRKARPIPFAGNKRELLQRVAATDADYVFLSRMNPRQTSMDFDGLSLRPFFDNVSTVAWQHTYPKDNQVVSVLLAIDKAKLKQWLVDSKAQASAANL